MSLSLAELLPLVGRLDDAPGFDTPRERFRRFLLERATHLPTMQALIEECQRSVGEQHHRVLQDLIVVVGRILRFAITFGTYERSTEDLSTHGRWRSAGLLDVVLQIETDHTGASLEPLARAVAASRAAPDGEELKIGLCVVARQSAARGKLVRQIAEGQFQDIRVVSVRSLLLLAAHVAADRVGHAEVVELLHTSAALDFMIDLVTRPDAGDRSSESRADEGVRPAALAEPRPAYWVAIVNGDAMVTPERWLASVITDRQVLAVGDGDQGRDHAAPGDWVCFYVANKGIVGHAQLGYVVEDGASVVRHGEKFGRVYRLAHLTLYERPVVQALRAGRPFAVLSSAAPFAGSSLAPIARQDFLALTISAEAAPQGDSVRSAVRDT
jgi:hypothetical protein